MTSSKTPSLRAAFLSSDGLDGFVIDDDRAYGPFADAGIDVQRVSWRATDPDWDQFDIVIVRSTWDYTDDPSGFFAVLHNIDASRATLANPLEVMKWNSRKTYLRDLESAGAAIVPTRWGDSLDEGEFATLAQSFGGDAWVIKPAIGANAEHAYALDGESAITKQSAIEASFAERDWMAQPFMHAIRSEGEFSLFYFAGEFSHAILKTPKPGDFRVQEEHGGLIKAVAAQSDLRAAGDTVVSALPGDLLYARIDLVRDGEGDFRIMEVELIEPSMYLRMDDRSPHRFAAAARDWLRRQ